MTVLLLCLVVVCVTSLAVLFALAVAMRRRLVRSPAVFPCTVRVLHGAVPRLPTTPPGRAFRARWAHDVIVLHHGVCLPWVQPLPVRTAENVIEVAGAAAGSRLGAGAVQLRLRLDDDAVVAIAAPAWAYELLAGPFLATAAHRQPPGVTERRGR